ncbi:hypothetical protein NL676_012468 [Syzygium grande]|nr:hypothetical protein NL676_012468 [Syzygium grande]
MADAGDESNPLLQDFEFPPYDTIEPRHIRPAIDYLLKKLESDLEELERTVEPTWPKLVEPFEKIVDRWTMVWGIINHLEAVKDTAELRAATDAVQADKVKFDLRLEQSEPIHSAFEALRESLDDRSTKRRKESPDWKMLSDARRRVVEDQIRKRVLNGVALKGGRREEFNEIEQQLRKLSRKFDENIMDATRNFEKLITDKKMIEGLSSLSLGWAAQTAVSKGYENATAEDGPWVITLDEPSYRSFMGSAQNRALREEIYRAYAARASSGDTDNSLIIDEILKLRLEKAKLLGYDNYAEVSMATRMATIDKVEELLEKLRSASWDAAVQDMEDLKRIAKNEGAKEGDDMSYWDIAFWKSRLLVSKRDELEIAVRKCDNEIDYSDEGDPEICDENQEDDLSLRDINFGSERLLEAEDDIDEEDPCAYLSLPKVMEGLFNLARTLFGIEIEAADGLAPVWNSDVRFYRVKNSTGNPIAYFYHDPFSRPSEKRGGSWTSEVVGRSRVLSRDGASARLPIAIVVCNQTPALGNKPALMTFEEVKIVFHEFGHALQHMLTEQDEGLVAGLRGIEEDAVELPSLFMENWCYHR